MIRLTRAQVREVDRIAIEKYRVPGVVLMENAARGVVDVAWQMMGGQPYDVDVVCGGGNNGGDGLAVARHLHNRGCHVTVWLAADPAHYRGDALINWEVLKAMDLAPGDWGKARFGNTRAGLVIDALFGTGLSKPIAGVAADFVHEINRVVGNKTLAIDVPSGLDCDTGLPLGPSVRATKTVTFVAEKAGFANPASRQYTGEVIVADIGCPREIIDEVLRSPI